MARPTVAPTFRLSWSRKAGGTANMTEPPTLRRLVVCIFHLARYIIRKYNTGRFIRSRRKFVMRGALGMLGKSSGPGSPAESVISVPTLHPRTRSSRATCRDKATTMRLRACCRQLGGFGQGGCWLRIVDRGGSPADEGVDEC